MPLYTSMHILYTLSLYNIPLTLDYTHLLSFVHTNSCFFYAVHVSALYRLFVSCDATLSFSLSLSLTTLYTTFSFLYLYNIRFAYYILHLTLLHDVCLPPYTHMLFSYKALLLCMHTCSFALPYCRYTLPPVPCLYTAHMHHAPRLHTPHTTRCSPPYDVHTCICLIYHTLTLHLLLTRLFMHMIYIIYQRSTDTCSIPHIYIIYLHIYYIFVIIYIHICCSHTHTYFAHTHIHIHINIISHTYVP